MSQNTVRLNPKSAETEKKVHAHKCSILKLYQTKSNQQKHLY